LPGEQVRQKFIVECIKEGKGNLNLAHLLMAQLMVNGFVRILLTTNFDDLLLRALQLYFEYPSIIDADSTHTLLIDSMFLQIAYLHGRLTSYRQRHTERELHQAMPDLQSFIVSAMKDHGLVVVGYRGGEEAPMKILSKALRRRGAGPGGGLFWVSHEKNFEKLSENTQAILRMKDTYWLPGWDADDFFEKLCASPGIGLSLPDFLCDPKKFARRLGKILPEKARGPWSEFQEAGSDLAAKITTIQPPGSMAQEKRVKAPSLERTPVLSDAVMTLDDYLSPSTAKTPEQKIEACKRATAINPENAKAFYYWGDALSDLGRFEEAIDKFRRATEIDPTDSWAFAGWGNALREQGMAEEAIDKYKRATDADPKHAWALTYWGDILQKQGRDEEAIEKYRLATEADPKHAWAFTEWGNTLQKQGRDEEAIEKYRLATEAGPEHHAAFSQWANILQKQGRDEEAIEKYRAATEIYPESLLDFFNWAKVLTKLGRDEEAIEKYRRATEISPNFAGAFALWGQALRKLNRDEEAIEKYRRATEVSPNYAGSFALWGHTLQQLGRDEEAIEKFRRATEIDPKLWAVFGRWASALQTLGRDTEAIPIFEQAIKLSPKKAALHVSLAASYRKLNRQAGYAAEIQAAGESIANESEYNRACFESVRGNTDEALALLKVALEKKQQRLDWVRRDPDLDFIRDDLRFKALVQSE